MSPGERVSRGVQMVSEAAGFSYAALWSGWRWLLAPLCDDWSGLSLNRFIAILFAVSAVHGRLAHDVPITVNDILLAVLAGSLSFGKDVWLAYLNRKKEGEAG